MALTRQSGNEFLSSRGEGTTMKQRATLVAVIGLLLLTSADSANADPAGRYDWKTSYDFHSALPSHDSRIQGNLTAEARPLDMAPIETSLPYLTVASKGSEHEFSSTYGS